MKTPRNISTVLGPCIVRGTPPRKTGLEDERQMKIPFQYPTNSHEIHISPPQISPVWQFHQQKKGYSKSGNYNSIFF